MAASNLKALALFALTLPAIERAAAVPAHAAREDITVDAQSLEMDLNSNSVVYRKVHIAQGAMTVSADSGSTTKGTGIDFNDSLWMLRGNVKITMADGALTSDDAAINFAKQALAKAVVNGNPAAFEQLVAKTGKVAHGRADTIDYDAGRGVVLLSKNAWLSDGQTEIRGESLKYDVRAHSIVAEGSEQGSQRVHIIITPPPSKP